MYTSRPSFKSLAYGSKRLFLSLELLFILIVGGRSKLADSCSRSEGWKFPFLNRYRSLIDVMMDKELAALGDAFANFVFSLALSRRFNRPLGMKVQSLILSRALRKADIRKLLPHRVDRHKQADAAEALIVYGWITGTVTIEECVGTLERETEPDEAFGKILQNIVRNNRFG